MFIIWIYCWKQTVLLNDVITQSRAKFAVSYNGRLPRYLLQIWYWPWKYHFLCTYHIGPGQLRNVHSKIYVNYQEISNQTSGPFIYLLDTLRPRRSDRHFVDDTFKCIFLNDKIWFYIKLSLNLVQALVQIMAWRRPSDKPLSEPMMVRLLMHASLCLNGLMEPSQLKAKSLSESSNLLQTRFLSCAQIITLVKS